MCIMAAELLSVLRVLALFNTSSKGVSTLNCAARCVPIFNSKSAYPFI